MSALQKFYEPERKEEFLGTIRSSSAHKDMVSVFKWASEFEHKYEKDLCAFNLNEAQEFADKKLPSASASKVTYIYLLRRYCKWCVGNGVENANYSFREIRLPSVEQYKRKYVASPAHLQRYLDAIFETESLHTIDNTRRGFLWLAFMGVRSRDAAIAIRTRDVDFESMRVSSQFGSHKIYTDAVPALRNCQKLSAFNHIHGSNYETVMDRENSDLLLRGTARAKLNVDSMRSSISKKTAAAKSSNDLPEITFTSLYKSGLFYRMYEEETAGWQINFDKVAKQDKLRYNPNGTEAVQLDDVEARDARQLEQDYICWKMAFHG